MTKPLICSFIFGLLLACASKDTTQSEQPPVPKFEYQRKADPLKKKEPYKRKWYSNWIDEDNDCQDTRQEVLISESKIPVDLDAKGCKVIKGFWIDPYTGNAYTNPKDMDIDHLVPLKETHESGGYAWSKKQRQAYANDLSFEDHLIAVHKGINRSKGTKDPVEWMPPNKKFQCRHIKSWIEVKENWRLGMDKDEVLFIRQKLQSCERKLRFPARTKKED